jgi:cytochrome c oxidase subunit IV
MENKINNNIQTKTTWSDTERWVAAVIATSCTFGFMYWLYTIGYLLYFGIYTFLTWLVVIIVFIVKHLIDELIDGR